MKRLYYCVTAMMLLGCRDSGMGKVPRNPDIDFDQVAFVKIIKGNDTTMIKDSHVVEDMISKIEKSEFEFIKFGPSDTFFLLDKDNAVIEQGGFGGNLIKIKGVVYRMKEEIE